MVAGRAAKCRVKADWTAQDFSDSLTTRTSFEAD
jgi:hypothetical protein